MDTQVVEIVDKLLDTIKYEIDRMRELGEDTTVLENQLREFRKQQRELMDWIMNNDEASTKLFLSELVEFSKMVHRYYQDVKSGKHLVDLLAKKGAEEIAREEEEVQKTLESTYELIADEDYLLREEFGEAKREQEELSQMDNEGSVEFMDENEKEGVMDTSITGVDDKVKDIGNMIKEEREKIEMLKRKGVDTLDKEFVITQQESLLVSMKEALLEGDYEEAERLKKEILRLRGLLE